MNILYVAIGGGAGAAIRYLIQNIAGRHDGHAFPLSTLAVNLLGCIGIGILAAFAYKFKWNDQLGLLLITGLLGGFTTFSAFSIEFFSLLNNNHLRTALLYWVLSCVAGPALTGLGFYISK